MNEPPPADEERDETTGNEDANGTADGDDDVGDGRTGANDTDDPPPASFRETDPHLFTIVAVGFELMLIPMAWFVERIWALPPPPPPAIELRPALWGLAATLPLLLGLLVITRTPVRRARPLRSIHDRIAKVFGNTLAGLQLWQITAIAAAAGIGEEILFRGALQPRLGMVGTAVVFGLLHWATFTYALLAGAISLYLSWILVATENLLAPVIVHAAYDFVALVVIRTDLRKGGYPRRPSP